MKYKHGDCLGVTWYDAFEQPETWTTNSDIDFEESYRVFSCGFYFGESKKYLVLTGDVAMGKSGRIMHIPKNCISKTQKFKC